MRIKAILIPVIAVSLCFPASVAHANVGSGDLDPTFSSDGKAQVGFGGGYDRVRGNDVLVQSSGKVVLVAPLTDGGATRFGVARLRPNGSPDPTFSGNGRRTTTFTGNDVPRRVVGLGAGRVLVGGSAGSAFGLAAYLGDGSLDPAFGTGGKVTTDVTGGLDQVLDLRARTDGTILAAGLAGNEFAVVRYLPDGTPDPAFGAGGVVLTTDGFDGVPSMVRLQPDGRLLAVGWVTATGHTRISVSRYDVDGSLDESFGGGDGRVTTFSPTNEESLGSAVLVQPNGRILVGGSAYGPGDYSYFCLVRYLPNGSPDPGFGEDGLVVHRFRLYYAGIYALARQGDGKIVAAGWTSGEDNALAISRYTSAGKLDRTFSRDGLVAVKFGASDHVRAYAVAARHGRIVAAGERLPSRLTPLDTAVVVRLRQ